MGISDYAAAPGITPGATSYFSPPSAELDPELFQGTDLKISVREGVLSILFDYLVRNFNDPHRWTKAWLAGSGVSYQWEASRQPGDLDCLVGIEYTKFRQSNTEYSGYSDQEIASMFNEGFNEDIMPNTRNWNGYELTFYVNQQTDIRNINPYAAYDLIGDFWTVAPNKNVTPPYSREWEHRANRDHAMALEILNRHNAAINEFRSTNSSAYRINAERKIKLAQDQAAAYFDDIHSGRKKAFSKTGAGYADYNNYRWQAGKRSGAVQALRSIKDQRDLRVKKENKELYGVDMPNTSTLIRRSLRG
jgi:hypothetical protein